MGMYCEDIHSVSGPERDGIPRHGLKNDRLNLFDARQQTPLVEKFRSEGRSTLNKTGMGSLFFYKQQCYVSLS